MVFIVLGRILNEEKQKTVLQIVITAVILIAIIFTVWSSLTKDKDKVAQVRDDAPLLNSNS